MPLLLRKSAPSPSVDELSFTKRPLPLAPATDAPRCLMHASSRSSLRRLRRSSESTTENTNNNAEASGVVANESEEDASATTTTPRCTCGPSRRSSQGSRKRFSAKLEESDTLDPQRDTEEDGSHSSGCSHDRDSTCNKCAARASGEESSVYDSDDDRSVAASDTSSKVVIRDTQLAVVDVELKNLRKTFVKTVYAKLTQMSRRLGRRSGADTKRITSS
ncbi:hypothetical protein PINS_up010882 [Pythium insidiosum]|nr:hypothetical protein PINS_up010882 [Pythium insidiosum]